MTPKVERPVETDHSQLVRALVEKAEFYDEKYQRTKQAEKRDGADYTWTWNYYEGKATAFRDAASLALRLESDPR